MDTIARQVCLNAGGDTCMRREDAESILKVLRNYFQPHAHDHIYRKGTKFSQQKPADQTTTRYVLEFDVLRRMAEARAMMGGAFPDASVFVLCVQNASQSKNGKSLLPASVQGSLDFSIVAKQMRHIFEPRGGVAQKAVLAGTDCGMESEEESSAYEAWAAYREARKVGKDSPRKSRRKSGGAKEVKGDR